MGHLDFHLDVYNELVQTQRDANLVFSPLSISFALLLTLLGSRNETKNQLKKVMKLDKEDDEIHKYFKELHSSLVKNFNDDDENSLYLVNKIYGQEDHSIQKEFLEKAKEFYLSEVGRLNFRDDEEGALQTINKDVSDLTKEKIKNFLKSEQINQQTKIILINALYFKASWDLPFNKAFVRKGNFHVTDQKTKQVDFMEQSKLIRFTNDETLGCQAIELYFSEQMLSMIFLLPNKEKTNLTEVEKKLTSDTISKMIWYQRKVEITLPKFKIESSFSLMNVLKKLGVSDLFHASKADLSGMDSSGELFVSDLLHKTFIDVNEDGCEATSATVVMVMLGSSFQPEQTEQFKADHPFLFLIKEHYTNNILFLGRVVDP